MLKPIYPCLWFDGQAKAAADMYCSVFNNSKITENTPMVVNFELGGQKFMGLNGGPHFKINPSISFYVVCETEDEIDAAWQQLSKGGSVLMPLDKYDWSEKYGWVEDSFGVNWQLSLGKLADVGQRFTPTLMFVGEQHGKAAQAIDFYTSIFDNSETVGILHYDAKDGEVLGTIKHAQFRLNQNVFMAMDSSYAHAFQFNEAVSFVVECDTQEEINYYWNKLTEKGQESQCGWLKDQFGVSWQIIPSILSQLMSNPEKSQRVVQAFMQMKKFDIEKLKQA
ncbi:MAG: VOC family protein [Chitinophagales bacterium]